jgi:hypothetical protein
MTNPDTPDSLSEWILPPPAAREAGDAEPIRVFASAEDAIRFLAGQDRRTARVLAAEPAERASQPASETALQ